MMRLWEPWSDLPPSRVMSRGDERVTVVADTTPGRPQWARPRVVRNVGSGPAADLAPSAGEKGKPFLTLAGWAPAPACITILYSPRLAEGVRKPQGGQHDDRYRPHHPPVRGQHARGRPG